MPEMEDASMGSMGAKVPQSSLPQSSYLQHHHIKCLCWNVTDMTGDNLQWQLQGGGQSAGTISIHYICVHASRYSTDKQEDVGFSTVLVHGVHLIFAWQPVMSSPQTRHWQVS